MLEIYREIRDRQGEASSFHGLGMAYTLLGQHQLAIDSHQHSYEIVREIGARHYEAVYLFHKAIALAQYEPRRFEALATFRQARTISVELDDLMVKQCDEAIYNFNQTFATKEKDRQTAPVLPSAPTIGNVPPKDDWYKRSLPEPQTRPASQRQVNWVLWFCFGVAIVLLITWLRK